mgnify:CR=1 FL=1
MKNPIIESFQIKSNYIIKGLFVQVCWKVKNALFVKVHTGSWFNGWMFNKNKILLKVHSDKIKVKLLAFGISGIAKEELIIQTNISLKSKQSVGKIKKNKYSESRLVPKSSFSLKTGYLNFSTKMYKPISLKENIIRTKIKTKNLNLN